MQGLREPDLATLVRISRVLQTTPDALLGVESPGNAAHEGVLAAYNALDDVGRRLAVRVLDAMAEHHAARDR